MPSHDISNNATVGGTLGVMFLLPPMMLGLRRFRSSRTRHKAAATTHPG